ncbi:MAG: PD40 domain-containing protein [Actinobacteria bacterium]|nr:PD40 domain-containing protein [Actinomycetota bacterium]
MGRNRFCPHAAFLFVILISALLAAVALGGCGKGKQKWWNDQSREDEGGETHAEGFAGIAYVRGSHIYLADAEKKEERRLTTEEGGYSCLAFSPDAGKLAATMVVGDADPQLVVVDVESGEMTDVSWTNEDYSGAWSKAGVRPWFGTIAWEDGDTLYATAVAEKLSRLYPRVVKVDLSAPGVEVLAEDAANPALSPDGGKLAYVRRPEDWDEVAGDSMWLSDDPGDLVVRDLKSGDEKEVRVTVDGIYRGHVFTASFSPDGDHLAVVCYDEPDTAVYYTDLKGETAYALDFVGPAGRIWQTTFSPDGQWLAYHSTWIEDVLGNRTYSLHVVPTGEANPEALTFEGLRDPAWSPVPHGKLKLKDLEKLLGGQGEGGDADEKAEIEAAMIAFVKANAAPGLEFRIENLVVRGNEAAGIAVCTNERLDAPLVVMRKGPHGWEGVDFGTGIEPPSWYQY